MGGGSSKVVEEWRNSDGTQWYRKWSSGLIEQWGLTKGTQGEINATFYKPFSNSEYFASAVPHKSSAFGAYFAWRVIDKSTTGFSSEIMGAEYKGANNQCWYACGYQGKKMATANETVKKVLNSLNRKIDSVGGG